MNLFGKNTTTESTALSPIDDLFRSEVLSDYLSRRDLGRRSSFFGGHCHRAGAVLSPGSFSGVFYLALSSTTYDKAIGAGVCPPI